MGPNQPNDIEVEYGYNSEEESIFHSFAHEKNEKDLVHKHGKKMTTNKDTKRCTKEVKDILRRVSLINL